MNDATNRDVFRRIGYSAGIHSRRLVFIDMVKTKDTRCMRNELSRTCAIFAYQTRRRVAMRYFSPRQVLERAEFTGIIAIADVVGRVIVAAPRGKL